MRLIDADKLKRYAGTYDGTDAQVEAVEVKYIDKAPTVLADNYSMGYQDGVKKVLSERPQGKWKALNYHTCYCTNCHFDFDIMKCDFMTKMNFCPNCGADMRGEK